MVHEAGCHRYRAPEPDILVGHDTTIWLACIWLHKVYRISSYSWGNRSVVNIKLLMEQKLEDVLEYQVAVTLWKYVAPAILGMGESYVLVRLILYQSCRNIQGRGILETAFLTFKLLEK